MKRLRENGQKEKTLQIFHWWLLILWKKTGVFAGHEENFPNNKIAFFIKKGKKRGQAKDFSLLTLSKSYEYLLDAFIIPDTLCVNTEDNLLARNIYLVKSAVFSYSGVIDRTL